MKKIFYLLMSTFIAGILAMGAFASKLNINGIKISQSTNEQIRCIQDDDCRNGRHDDDCPLHPKYKKHKFYEKYDRDDDDDDDDDYDDEDDFI